MRRATRGIPFIALLALPWTAQAQDTAPDVAEPPSAETSSDAETVADALTEQAREATAAGRHDEAAALLREALAQAPGAARAFNLSLVLRDAGELVAAVETMDALLAGRYGDLPDDRRARAEEIRAEIGARVATLVVRVSGAERVSLQLDEQPIADAVAGTPLRLQVDPGEHVVTARAEGRASITRTVDAAAGRSTSVSLTLEPTPDSDPILAPPSPDPVVDEASGPSPWLFVAIGAALAVVAAGVIALALVLGNSETAEMPEVPEGFLGRAETLRF